MKKLLLLTILMSSVCAMAQNAKIHYDGETIRFKEGAVCHLDNNSVWLTMPECVRGGEISVLAQWSENDPFDYTINVKKSGFVYIIVHKGQTKSLVENKWEVIDHGLYGYDRSFNKTAFQGRYAVLKKYFEVGTYEIQKTKHLKTRIIVL